ncbi:unnamed protein product [Ixodes pacificus]
MQNKQTNLRSANHLKEKASVLHCVSVVDSARLAASHNERDARTRRRRDERVCRSAASLVEVRRVCRLGAGRGPSNDDVMRGASLLGGVGRPPRSTASCQGETQTKKALRACASTD